jgi:NAD(P) transhydrogenase subunit beta
MQSGILTVSYLFSSVMFILSLGGLSRHETARRGNLYGIVGFIVAITATVAMNSGLSSSFGLLGATILIGGIVGYTLAKKVEMTSMPQLVAILHSFVGLAAVLVGISTYLGSAGSMHGSAKIIHDVETFLGVFIGGLTFTGSVVAFGKLHELIRSKPLLIPGRHLFNLLVVVASIGLGVWFVGTDAADRGMLPLLIMTGLSFFLGWHMVMAIGGADMPVVVSMLNSYSGWAAAATGFLLANDLLIVTGALVGSSGAILSYIMCKAMNRSFVSVILGGFGAESGSAQSKGAAAEQGTVTATSAEEVAHMLRDAREVVIVPGYGMAVAQAQHPVREITEVLRAAGVNVRFAIHPVAGRLPGHMNVLLAEANVPYDIVLEMDEINHDLPATDVVLILGANDIVNPGALDDPSSPIYGMPVLEVWKARQVVVSKRGMATGYSGVDNPLFYKDNTLMLFGDAKKSVDAVLAALR